MTSSVFGVKEISTIPVPCQRISLGAHQARLALFRTVAGRRSPIQQSYEESAMHKVLVQRKLAAAPVCDQRLCYTEPIVETQCRRSLVPVLGSQSR